MKAPYGYVRGHDPDQVRLWGDAKLSIRLLQALVDGFRLTGVSPGEIGLLYGEQVPKFTICPGAVVRVGLTNQWLGRPLPVVPTVAYVPMSLRMARISPDPAPTPKHLEESSFHQSLLLTRGAQGKGVNLGRR